MLFNVSGMDADGKLVCLGYCLCEKENTETYDTFLGHILEIDIGDGQQLEEYLNDELTVIFSDRQKGEICVYVSVCVCNFLSFSHSLFLSFSLCLCPVSVNCPPILQCLRTDLVIISCLTLPMLL